MRRQKDFYSELAQKQGYLARSAFKLKEIDQKYRLVEKNMRILDLGASPGSWLQYVLEKCASRVELLAIDQKDLSPRFFSQLDQNVSFRFLKKDLFHLNFQDIPLQFFDLILSDLAPNTTSHKGLNHQGSLALVEEVIRVCDRSLKPKKNLLFKVFDGEDLKAFLEREIRSRFSSYQIIRPKSSRNESREQFILARTFRPTSNV